MELTDLDRRSLRLFLVGDLLAVLAFTGLGELRHGVNPATMPWVWLDTATPFLLGWLVVAPFGRAYSTAVRSGWRGLFVWTTVSWLGADAVGQALRATDLFHGGSEPVFYLVLAAVGTASLLVWRTVATLVSRHR